jgi:hypothetical protein
MRYLWSCQKVVIIGSSIQVLKKLNTDPVANFGSGSYLTLEKAIFGKRTKLIQQLKTFFKLIEDLKGQSHEKVGDMSVWGISLGPN